LRYISFKPEATGQYFHSVSRFEIENVRYIITVKRRLVLSLMPRALLGNTLVDIERFIISKVMIVPVPCTQYCELSFMQLDVILF